MITRIRHAGFALPTILISSVVMIIVLLAAVQSIVSINVALDNQYYDQLADEAAQSGVVKAKACVDVNGAAEWTTASPLRPNTNCKGQAATCPNVDTNVCTYIVKTPTIRSSFSVGPPTALPDGLLSISVTSSVELVRPSNNTVWKKFSGDAQFIMPSQTENIKISMVSGGQNAICGASNSGSLYCLGSNDNYRLGTGDPMLYGVYTFKQLQGELAGKVVSKFSVNGMHGCAISEGKVYCWGSQQNGALGTGGGGHKPTPTTVVSSGALAGKTMKTIMTAGTGGALGFATIYAHTCALDSDGNAYCWGANGAPAVSSILGGGQIGNGTVGGGDANVPAPVVGGLQFKEDQIVGGSWHTCAIRRVDNPLLSGDGWLYCWGSDNNGQVGNGSGFSPTGVPTRVQGQKANILDFEYQNAKFKQITAGQAHNCAITTSNTMWCWGQNSQGQLGVGGTGDGSVAQKVPLPSGEDRWIKVTAGTYWTCALANKSSEPADAGRVYCWGGASILGPAPYIGDGSTSWGNRVSPTAVVTSGVLAGKKLENIWTTWTTTIARDTDGKYYSWGINNAGTLGTGLNTSPDTNVPVAATHLSNFTVSSSVEGGIKY